MALVSLLEIDFKENVNNYHKLQFTKTGKCSIKQIVRANFQGLSKLWELFLDYNHIEKIQRGTFESLMLLDKLYLSEISLKIFLCHSKNNSSFADNNKIVSINGDTFKKLHKLNRLELRENQCIDEDFKNQSQLLASAQVVTERCGFCEIESSCEMFQMLKEMQETFMTRTLSMLMETHRKELRDKDAAIGQLKAEIGILKTNNQW